MRRRPLQTALVAVAAVLVCWQLVGHGDSRGIAAAKAALPAVQPAAASEDQIIVEPDAGMDPIYALLSSPRHSLDLTMYELVDPRAESILATDAARGVTVRVILDHRLEATRNQAAYDYLRARGVDVRWSSTRFFVTHEKTFVIDDRTAVVMSLNLTDRYYATSRDLAVVDHDANDAKAIESVFTADLHGGGTVTPPADDLVWSPGQSQADFLALINGAQHSISLESEELASRPVISALVNAERRGVRVSIAMTYDSDWASAFTTVTDAGAQVKVLHGETPLYIHAKLIVVDAGTSHARAFIGSENISDASLLRDRELGIVLLGRSQVSQVSSVIDRDFGAGAPWR